MEAELRRNANGELRRASKAIAERVPPMLGGSGAPQESAILAAAGPKSDRLVAVAVPARKPRLSGLRRTPAGKAKTLAFAVEGGSGAKQFHGPPVRALVGRHMGRVRAIADPEYRRVLAQIMTKYGLI